MNNLQNFEKKTGFDKIRELLKENCISSLGEDYVNKIYFTDDFALIDRLTGQTEEFLRILQTESGFPQQDYFDLLPELERISVPGTFIEPEALFDLKSSLNTIIKSIEFIKKLNGNHYPYTKELIIDVSIDNMIPQRIEQLMDDKGEIRDGASDELRRIRKDIISKSNSIARRSGFLLQEAKRSGWTPDDAEITIRNGRSVIPVFAASKRKLRGFIHDQSATGQTVYVEPEDIFETNNEIRELKSAEHQEIIKILTEITKFLRPFIPELIHAYRFLGLLDFIRAKARFAGSIEGIKPLIENKQEFQWKKAKHPLLFLSLRKQNKKVVPLDIGLDEKERILIISGPNAGGKSVCLKTVGLLQYMLQCGLLIPVAHNTIAGVFEHIFIEIGDEQSLENDLSTYSSHLMNVKNLIKTANSKTLFLIDEFGAGTDPQMGGAIAEAVLQQLARRNSRGVVTTHYSNLKLMASKTEGLFNGAMLFDKEKLQPLFILKTGNPGSSFAFEIAQNIGLPENILETARSKTGRSQLDFEEQVQQLEIEKEELKKKLREVNMADDFLAEVVKKYQRLSEELEISKKEIINKARTEAAELLRDSNRMIERTIKEIREKQAEKQQTKKLRKELKQRAEKIDIQQKKDKRHPEKRKPEPEPREDRPIKEGDVVVIKGQTNPGEVIRKKGDEVIVSFDSVKLTTTTDRIQHADRDQIKQKSKKHKSGYSSVIDDLNKRAADFKLTLDIRGQRAEEALERLKKYTDQSLLLGIREVKIIHGKGDGILRNVARDYLNSVKEVKKMSDDDPDRGGHGTTIVEFK